MLLGIQHRKLIFAHAGCPLSGQYDWLSFWMKSDLVRLFRDARDTDNSKGNGLYIFSEHDSTLWFLQCSFYEVEGLFDNPTGTRDYWMPQLLRRWHPTTESFFQLLGHRNAEMIVKRRRNDLLIRINSLNRRKNQVRNWWWCCEKI